jgi:hypothetical protein
MKNSAKCARRLAALLKQIADSAAPPPPPFHGESDPIAVLIASFLLWETTTDKAASAWKCIAEGMVDFNDLRVCMPQEIVECVGVRYPRAIDRCQRLRAVLRDIYCREHAVNLDSLREVGKREARKYVDSLEGMVPYVAARVSLLSFDVHAVPVDDRLRARLVEFGAADESIDNSALAVWLERHIKAEEAIAAHFALQAWADELTAKPSSRKTAERRSSGKSGVRAASRKPQSGGQSKKMSRT